MPDDYYENDPLWPEVVDHDYAVLDAAAIERFSRRLAAAVSEMPDEALPPPYPAPPSGTRVGTSRQPLEWVASHPEPPPRFSGYEESDPLDNADIVRIRRTLAERPLPPAARDNSQTIYESFLAAPARAVPKRKRHNRPYTQKQIAQIATVIRNSLVPDRFNEDFIRVQYNNFSRVVSYFSDYLCQQNNYRFNAIRFEQQCGMPIINKMWERYHEPSALQREVPLP